MDKGHKSSMKKYILTTGPALAHEVPLREVHSEKNIYRINGAHGTISDVEQSISNIRAQIPEAQILMDLPGNKVRTANIQTGIPLEKGKTFEMQSSQFNYPEFYRHLSPGMTAWANDSVFEFEVVSATSEKIVFRSKSNGVLINNKGVHVRGIHHDIPFLFEKDRQLIALANQYKLDFVGLSFVRTPENVKEAQALLGGSMEIISKIETIDAVEHINEILPLVSYILVDRGDLSTDIGIEKIPRFQKYIVEKALYFDVKVFLATQVLKNMETRPIPTIGEIEALYEIMKSGVYGVQMSEETAVGQYVAECVELLNRMDQEVMTEKIQM